MKSKLRLDEIVSCGDGYGVPSGRIELFGLLFNLADALGVEPYKLLEFRDGR